MATRTKVLLEYDGRQVDVNYPLLNAWRRLKRRLAGNCRLG